MGIAVAVMAIVILQSAGFWLLDPGMQWYVGMSGTLHGFHRLPAQCLDLRIRTVLESIVLLILDCRQSWLYEQLAGPLPGSEATSGGNVVVNAHLYGAIGGAIAGGCSFSVVLQGDHALYNPRADPVMQCQQRRFS